jgi:hypothetical protein
VAHHVLHQIGASERLVFIGDLVGARGRGEDAPGGEQAGEGGAVAGGHADPHPPSAKAGEVGGQVGVGEEPAVGRDDGLAVGAELAHVAGVEEHGDGVGRRVRRHPVDRAGDDAGGRLGILYQQPVVGGDAHPHQRLVHVLGVVDGRAKVVSTSGVVVDAHHHGPGPSRRHHPGPGVPLERSRGWRGRARGRVEAVRWRRDGEVAGGQRFRRIRGRFSGPDGDRRLS